MRPAASRAASGMIGISAQPLVSRRPEQSVSPPIGQERAKRRLAAVIVRALSWQAAAGWAALPHSILGGYPRERKARPAVPKATYARPAPLISAAGDR